MKIAWLVLLVSAFTDAIITFGTASGTMIAAIAVNPDWGAHLHWTMFIAPAIGGMIAGARTIQQAVKATPAFTAELKGQAVTTTTVTPDVAITTAAPVKPGA
jgi:hypothetical protein